MHDQTTYKNPIVNFTILQVTVKPAYDSAMPIAAAWSSTSNSHPQLHAYDIPRERKLFSFVELISPATFSSTCDALQGNQKTDRKS